MSFLTTNDADIYREELNPRLPRRIFDAHVHIFERNAFPADFAFPPKNSYQRFGGAFSLLQWRDLVAELLPEQQVSLNCFGTPHAQARRDVAPPADNVTVFAMTLLSPDSTEGNSDYRRTPDRLQALRELCRSAHRQKTRRRRNPGHVLRWTAGVNRPPGPGCDPAYSSAWTSGRPGQSAANGRTLSTLPKRHLYLRPHRPSLFPPQCHRPARPLG